MKVVIVGPGAIGCLFAGMLSRHGEDVWLLDRDPGRAKRLAANGIFFEEMSGAGNLLRIPVGISAKQIGAADMVLICVKAYDTEAALRHALPLFGGHTLGVSLQNGMGNVEILAGCINPEHVVCASTSQGAIRLKEGMIRHTGAGMTYVAPWLADHPAGARAVAALFNAAGVQTRRMDHADALIWSKLVISAGLNPVSALWGVSNGEVRTRPDLWALASDAAREAQVVAGDKGVALVYPDAVAALEEVCRNTSANRSSMLQDLQQGRRTEIEQINGAVVREAAVLGVPVPVNQDLMARVLQRAAAKKT